ncbi:DUF2617 family protein [Calycomorphotria hydatis]|uniref:DUF2617 domain-containing protein n=1 Tax=Calycomorphotria hydatis TaxID=2528027 RepID=A0A517T872_9PLAN|nr:DUF2617 family protein [Calycomorphotria hydatis]QDT64576.1 hypothetical protein V22_18110 [Calycomorphotria hydatis]
MSTGTIRPVVDDLLFRLYDRSLHPELFTTRAKLVLQREEFDAHVSLSDSGHVIGFRRGERTLTEVITVENDELPLESRLLNRRIRGTRNDGHTFPDGVTYQASYQIEKLDAEVFQHLHEELVVDALQAELSFRFVPGNRLLPEPLSLARISTDQNSLLIHICHTFPDEFAIIRTQSLIEYS